MKGMNWRNFLLVVSLYVLTAGNCGAFSFQGELSDGGELLAGPVDIEVALFDSPAGGSLIDGPLFFSNVALEGGRFTIDAQFDDIHFNGAELWLEVTIYDPPGGPATVLSPRQRVEHVPYAHHAQTAPWSGLYGVPTGFADNTDDDALADLSCAEGQVAKRQGGDWSCADDAGANGDISGVNAGSGLTGGGDSGDVTLAIDFAGSGASGQASRSDHHHDASYYQQSQLQTAGQAQIHFDNLTAVPAGVSDGDDDVLGALNCSEGQVPKRIAGNWDCADDVDGGGDITAVNAGSGLSGGGVSGDVLLSILFAGDGSAVSAARSDHLHDALYPRISALASAGQVNVHFGNLSALPQGLADGDNDVLGSLACSSDEIPRFNAGSWFCDTDQTVNPSVEWIQGGNAGTIPGTDYLGTSDAVPLVIKTSAVEAMRVDASRNVGIGVTAPQATLDVSGKIQITSGVNIHNFSTRVTGDSGAGIGWYILRDETAGEDRLLVNQSTGDVVIAQSLGVGMDPPVARISTRTQTNGITAMHAESFSDGLANAAVANGSGTASLALTTDANNEANTSVSATFGTGRAAEFLTANPASLEPTVFSSTVGGSAAVYARSDGIADAVIARSYSTGSAGYFEFDNENEFGIGVEIDMTGSSGSRALDVWSNYGPAGWFVNSAGYSTITATNNSYGSALEGVNSGQFNANCPACTATISGFQLGNGWIAYLEGNGVTNKGLFVRAAQGQPGLQVAGGTKNAVVKTSRGSRALYTEESAEVWFSDYGEMELVGGVAEVVIDPLFAETVNLNLAYHVFVQSYSSHCGALVVSVREPDRFTVEESMGGTCEGEFSWRLVARRLGYEDTRLEGAPWADVPAKSYRDTLDSKSSRNGVSNRSAGAGQKPPRKSSTPLPTTDKATASG